MRRLAETGLAAVALLLVACGGGGGSKTPTPAPTAPATTRPSSATATPSGPSASVDPKQGPPGTDVTRTGAGWQPGSTVSITGEMGSLRGDRAYGSPTVRSDGSFQSSFVLDKAPDGSDLQAGRLDFVLRSGATEVRVAFQVQSRRPVQPTPSGG